MPLTVEVTRYKGQPLNKQIEASYLKDDFTIGRSADKKENHLCLPDPNRFISRKHVSISFKNGAYILTDNSVEGTFLINKNLRVCRETVTLSDKEKLKIGDYELVIHIFSIDNSEPDLYRELPPIEDNAFFFEACQGQPENQPAFSDNSNADGYKTCWNDVDLFEEDINPPGVSAQYGDSPLNDAYEPPNIVEESVPLGGIPDDFNFADLIGGLEGDGNNVGGIADSGISLQKKGFQDLRPKSMVDVPVPNQMVDSSEVNQKEGDNAAPEPAKKTRDSYYPHLDISHPDRKQIQLELFHIFLKAAGLNDASLGQDKDIPAVMQAMGKVYGEMINGLMMILRGRSELKTQIQVPVTRIKPAENNPLKFCQSAEEAIRQFISKDQPGFLGVQESVREGLADIMNHQIAMTAGVQAAVINLIERLNPQNYVKQFEEGVVFQKKAKAWDAYRQAYGKIADGALEDFFGERFGRAYEAQIRKLQSKTKDR
jgi:predicted component of type VI protein secretion system